MTGTVVSGDGLAGAVLVLAPEAILVLGAVACLLLGSFTPRRHLARVTWAATAVVVASLTATVLQLLGLPDVATSAVKGTVAIDPLSGAVRLSVAGALLVLLRTARREGPDHPRAGELAVLLLLGGAGSQLLGLTTDLSVLVLAFLLASIPLYGVMALSPDPGRTPAVPEAVTKTYLLGALSGVLLMLGCVVVAGVSGGTTYATVAAATDVAVRAPVALVGGLVLVLVGLLFKVAAPPLHPWLPDAVSGCSVTAGGFATTVPKLGGVVAAARAVEALPADAAAAEALTVAGTPVGPLLLGSVAVLAMAWGTLAALTQSDVRRLLAWSTIGQSGFLLAGAAAVATPGSGELAVRALALFLPAYATANLTCFVVLLAAPDTRSVRAWAGAGREHPGLVVVLGIGLLSLVGTPPAGVLVGKVLVLGSTWQAGLPWVAATLVVTTVLSLAYSLRWLAACLAPAPPGAPGGTTEKLRRRAYAPGLLAPLAAASLATGLAAGPLLALLGP